MGELSLRSRIRWCPPLRSASEPPTVPTRCCTPPCRGPGSSLTTASVNDAASFLRLLFNACDWSEAYATNLDVERSWHAASASPDTRTVHSPSPPERPEPMPRTMRPATPRRKRAASIVVLSEISAPASSMRVNVPVRTPAAARSVKRRNWSRAVPVIGSMDRDTVSWTSIDEAEVTAEKRT